MSEKAGGWNFLQGYHRRGKEWDGEKEKVGAIRGLVETGGFPTPVTDPVAQIGSLTEQRSKSSKNSSSLVSSLTIP